MVEIRPLLGRDGEVLLYDLYIDDKWHGSRRLLPMWNAYLRGKGLPPVLSLDKSPDPC